MEIFDDKGLMIFPRPERLKNVTKEKIILIKNCFCPNGHNLVNKRAIFNGYNGVVLKVIKGQDFGIIALSPIFGDKTRICLDITLEDKELLKIVCPSCDAQIPVYSQCECGGDLLALFTQPDKNFSNSVGFCNRVNCANAEIISGGELLNHSMIELL
ncbi:MAG: hypothetical protein JEY94_13595 [Melioribacteraceae bacterium]|nr:hypothetical protein [Melioribacteraceae bacterium]